MSSFFDRVRETASDLGNQAQRGLDQGQAKLDERGMRKDCDNLAKQIGYLVWQGRTQGGGPDEAELERLCGLLSAREADIANLRQRAAQPPPQQQPPGQWGGQPAQAPSGWSGQPGQPAQAPGAWSAPNQPLSTDPDAPGKGQPAPGWSPQAPTPGASGWSTPQQPGGGHEQGQGQGGWSAPQQPGGSDQGQGQGAWSAAPPAPQPPGGGHDQGQGQGQGGWSAPAAPQQPGGWSATNPPQAPAAPGGQGRAEDDRDEDEPPSAPTWGYPPPGSGA
jgi:hypothetical protein